MKIEAGGGTDSEVSLSGQSYFRATNSMSGPRPIRYTTGFFVKAILGQLCLVSPEGEKIKLSRNGMPITYESSDVVVSPSDGWVYFEIQVLNSNNAADTNDMAVHLTAGGSCYFALPRVLPGWLSPGRNRAVVPNRYIAGT